MTPRRVVYYTFLALAASTVLACGNDPDEEKKIATLRLDVLKAESSEAMADAYKKLFTHLGLVGLKTLADDKNTSIALQAAWESHKKIVKREKPISGRTDWVFDRKGTEEFVRIFAERTEAKPPAWWQSSLLNGEVFPDKHHAFIEREKDPPSLPKFDFDADKDQVTVTAGKVSIKVSKDVFGNDGLGQNPTGLLGKEQSFLASPPSVGCPFNLVGVESKTGKVLWKAEVWAARRGLFGGRGYHHVEVRRQKDTVIVYGCESHGMYAEGFNAMNGESQFRFCTCYWFNFSETWGLK